MPKYACVIVHFSYIIVQYARIYIFPIYFLPILAVISDIFPYLCRQFTTYRLRDYFPNGGKIVHLDH